VKVGFLIQHYPPYLGGAECQARDLAEALVSRGHTVEVATTRWDRSEPPREARHGVGIRRWPTPRLRWLRFPWNLLTGFAAGWSLSGRCQILHGHCLSAFVLGGLVAARWRGCPALVKPCSLGPEGDVARIRRPWMLGLAWWMARSARGFLVQTRAVGAELQGEGIPQARIHRLPSLFPRLGSEYSESALPLSPPSAQVLYVGRLHPGKGLHTLMAAWPTVARSTGWRWTVVGDGPMRQEMLDWIEREGLQDSVALVGYQPDPTPWFRNAEVLVFPSYSESFGNVLVEALQAGCGVLTTRVGVAADWPPEAPVIRLPPADPRAWEQALQDWAAQPETQRLSCRRAARQFARAHHHPDGVLSRLEALYLGHIDAAVGGSAGSGGAA
tara:strand:+ start:80386 stop:81540 length:1155 start_codon:yes stop_codon:yes gene_type:complete